METAELIKWGGVLLIVALVFAETGLLLGLVIPGGETLVFSSGLLVSTGTFEINIALLLVLLVSSAFFGDCSGFLIGRKFQARIYHKKETWYFKRKYLLKTEEYLKQHRKKAMIFGKFIPIVRPFVSILAGVTKMKWKALVPLSLAGNTFYIGFFLLAGYFLGNRFPIIEKYLWLILPVTFLLLLVPVIIQYKKGVSKTN